MAYDRDFLKVTFGFTIVNTDEIAQTSLNFSEVADPTFNSQAALAEINMPVVGPLVLARMGTLLATSNIKYANYSRLNTVRIAAVSAEGPEYEGAKLYEDSTPQAGGFTDVPPQISVVLSLRSGFSAGSANFGRMYIPHLLLSLATGTARVDATILGAFATAAATFVTGVKTDLDAVVSAAIDPMIMTQVPSATSRKVTQIAIGDVLDTQRRRRNQLPENYTFRTVP